MLVGICVFIASEAATIFVGIIGEWHLMYPAYFTYDIEVHYVAAHLLSVYWHIIDFSKCHQ